MTIKSDPLEDTHSIAIKTISKMKEFTYEQIRTKALKQGVKDNKVHIGLWANLNNYLKTRRKKNGKVTTYYISLQKLSY